MIGRCSCPKRKCYPCYGGRGIKVCERWRASFENFYADMGEPPSPRHTIERMNVNGDYEKRNCCWATMMEQNRNRRNNCHITADGETRVMQEWVDITGLPQSVIWQRLNVLGWTPEEALGLKFKERWKGRKGRTPKPFRVS